MELYKLAVLLNKVKRKQSLLHTIKFQRRLKEKGGIYKIFFVVKWEKWSRAPCVVFYG